MTTCPECGALSVDEARCDICRTVFEVQDVSEPPAASQASQSVDDVARTLGLRSGRATSGTFVEVTRPPAEPIALEMVPRTEQKRRTWLLFVLLLALAWFFVDHRQERRVQERVRVETARQEAEPPVDEAYLNLALETMLGEVRQIPEQLNEPGVAIHVERLLARVADLNARLEPAKIDESKYEAYTEALDALESFLRDDVRPALDVGKEPDAPEVVLSEFNLDAAEAAFDRAQGR